MTPKEAIKILNPDSDVVWKAYDGKDLERCNEACRVACVALEKQIPKKPILDTIFPSGVKWWRCPVCNKILVGCIAGRPQKYCDDCGQAIDKSLDWSDN